MEILEDLDIATEKLKNFIIKLQKESDAFYEKGDNFRGNIRYDAAAELKLKLDSLLISRSYIRLALRK